MYRYWYGMLGPRDQHICSLSMSINVSWKNSQMWHVHFALVVLELTLDKWLSAYWLTVKWPEKKNKTNNKKHPKPRSPLSTENFRSFNRLSHCWNISVFYTFPIPFHLCRNSAELCRRHHLWSQSSVCHAISGARQAADHHFSHHPMPGTRHHLHVSRCTLKRFLTQKVLGSLRAPFVAWVPSKMRQEIF